MKRKNRPLLALALVLPLLAPQLAAAAVDCFSIYDAANVLVYRSTTPPVNLSRPISEAMAEQYPGAHLIWMRDDTGCPALPLLAASRDAPQDLQPPIAQGTSPAGERASRPRAKS